MNRFLLFLSILIVVCSGFFSVNANANVVIVSAPPPVREVILPPGGYSACYMVGPRFINGYWAPAHRVCEYGPAVAQGSVWVAGYWQCTRYSYDGVCRYWVWNPAHWAVVNDYEYYRPWRVAYYQPAPVYHPVWYPAYYRRGWGPGWYNGGWHRRW